MTIAQASSESMRVILKRLIHYLWYVLAASIVTIAIMISLARMATPFLTSHRVRLQSFISHVLQQPVNIEQVKVGWYGFQPVIKFSNVTIYNKNKSRALLKVKSFALGVRLISSVLQRQLVPGLLVASGAHITLQQNNDGGFNIEGVKKFRNYNYQDFGSTTLEAFFLLAFQP